MGIPNLLVYFKPLTHDITLSKYAGQCIAVDAMCWMHRGAVASATELFMKTSPGPQFTRFFMKMVNVLLSHKIRPVIVFDGSKIPMKAAENEVRKTRRDAASAEAQSLLDKGVSTHDKRVRAKFVEAIKVTDEMIQAVVQVLRKAGIEYIIAPYEADAQLAFLCRASFVKAVITEDSDLLVYGCPKIIFKLNHLGDGQEIDISLLRFYKDLTRTVQSSSAVEDLSEEQEIQKGSPSSEFSSSYISTEILSHTCLRTSSEAAPKTGRAFRTILRNHSRTNAETEIESEEDSQIKSFSRDLNCLDYSMFVSMCVLSGCDYTADVHISGVGIKSSHSLICRYRTLEGVFKFFERDPKWKKKIVEVAASPFFSPLKSVPENQQVQIRHQIAQFVFENHYVYDPLSRKIIPIHFAESLDAISDNTKTFSEYFTFDNWTIHSDEILGRSLSPYGETLVVHELPKSGENMLTFRKRIQAVLDFKDTTRDENVNTDTSGCLKKSIVGSQTFSETSVKKRPLETKPTKRLRFENNLTTPTFSVERFSLDAWETSSESSEKQENALFLLNVLTSQHSKDQQANQINLSHRFNLTSTKKPLKCSPETSSHTQSAPKDIFKLSSFTYDA